jgi:hypothetical protein
VAKVTPQAKQTALQVAAVIASGLADRGVMPSDKALRNTCLTALRLSQAMDQVVTVVEKNDDLMTLPLDQSHASLHGLIAKAAEEPAVEPEPEAKPKSEGKAESKTEPPAK